MMTKEVSFKMLTFMAPWTGVLVLGCGHIIHILKIHYSLGCIVPLENFSHIWRRHHYRCRPAKFDLPSVFIAIEH